MDRYTSYQRWELPGHRDLDQSRFYSCKCYGHVGRAFECAWRDSSDLLVRQRSRQSAASQLRWICYPRSYCWTSESGWRRLRLRWRESLLGRSRAPKVQRANLDGANLQDLLSGGSGFPFGFPIGIALDVLGGKMYFAEVLFGQSIRRVNLDGSGLEAIVTGINAVTGVALDLSAGKVYWTNAESGGLGKIERANLNGSNRENLVTGLTAPRHLALDIVNGKIYWADQIDRTIQRANLNGSGLETVLTALNSPYGIALDIINGKVYWSEIFDGMIRRANINGSGMETIISGLVNPERTALLPSPTIKPPTQRSVQRRLL